MSFAEVLLRWFGLPMPNLIAFLRAAGDASPDLKPTADQWIEKLEGARIDATLAAIIKGEVSDIIQGRISPRDNPSNAI